MQLQVDSPSPMPFLYLYFPAIVTFTYWSTTAMGSDSKYPVLEMRANVSFCLKRLPFPAFALKGIAKFPPPERWVYMIQLTLQVALEVGNVGDPFVNWRPDTDN